MSKFLPFKIVISTVMLMLSVFVGSFFVSAQSTQQQLSGSMGTNGLPGFIPTPPPPGYDPVFESVSQKLDENAPLHLKSALKQRRIFVDSYDDYHGDKFLQDEEVDEFGFHNKCKIISKELIVWSKTLFAAWRLIPNMPR